MAEAKKSYKPVIDPEKCEACAICTRGCPAELIPAQKKEGTSLRGRIYQKFYRGFKEFPFLEMGKRFPLPPCEQACPLHQNIGEYIRLIVQKKYTEALAVIRESNPLPSVTGYVCIHPCEAQCIRCGVENPVSIKALKRFVADFDDGKLPPPLRADRNGKKVTIVGSGPAGLAAAYDLVRRGYSVEILEALSVPGGMLSWAIPPFRLPRNILERDVNYLRQMGITIKTGVRFGVDVTLAKLRKQGIAAVILAIGTQKGLNLGVENEANLNGYLDCLTFLRKYDHGEALNPGTRVVVVGGGNAAMDAARVALRCGAGDVSVFYRRSPAEMSADQDEVQEGKAEGIRLHFLAAPVRMIAQNGQAQGLEFIRTELGDPDDSGRRRPIPVKGSKFIVNAQVVISTVGQQPDLSWNREKLPLRASPKNTLLVDTDCRTGIPRVYAAGDVVHGPTDIVAAMASGKKAAQAVDAYLQTEESDR